MPNLYGLVALVLGPPHRLKGAAGRDAMTAVALLDRLGNVRRVAPGRWTACCPAHESRSRSSLSIAELSDGRVLVHDHAGCAIDEVLGAVGLTFDALYPPRLAVDESQGGRRYSSRPARPYVSAQLLDAVAGEALIGAAVISEAARGAKLSGERIERLWEAAGRLASVAGWAHGR